MQIDDPCPVVSFYISEGVAPTFAPLLVNDCPNVCPHLSPKDREDLRGWGCGIVLDIRGIASNVWDYSNACSNYLLSIPYSFGHLFGLTGSMPRLGVGALIYITIRTISHYRNLFARLVLGQV